MYNNKEKSNEHLQILSSTKEKKAKTCFYDETKVCCDKTACKNGNPSGLRIIFSELKREILSLRHISQGFCKKFYIERYEQLYSPTEKLKK